jgi:hypothetical protein
MRDGTERALPVCLDATGLEAIPPDEPRGCAIVETGSDVVWCEGGNGRIEVRWRVLPDASCVRTVCRRSLFPSVDCPDLP